jgi:hypothetical protein
MKRIGSAVMRNWQLITRALGFAAAVLTAGSALGAADHGHGGHEDAAVVAPPPAVVAPATQPAAVAPAPANRDNLPLLGGMLLASGLVSWGISHLLRACSGSAVAPAIGTPAIVEPTETANLASVPASSPSS